MYGFSFFPASSSASFEINEWARSAFDEKLLVFFFRRSAATTKVLFAFMREKFYLFFYFAYWPHLEWQVL